MKILSIIPIRKPKENHTTATSLWLAGLCGDARVKFVAAITCFQMLNRNKGRVVLMR